MSSTSIPSIPPHTTLTQLPNGLTVIVREDHSAPVVSVQAWCKAGAIHEGDLLGAGMSHALEHMLFKGTSNREGYRIDQEVQEAGGAMNAYTSFDRTVYYIDAPNTGTNVAISILSDIMTNATLPADELEKEKQVILREMDMNHDDPGRRASRRLFETAYTRSPYQFTIIGYKDIFNTLSREDLLNYYHRQYTPGNCFFVVAGDVKTDDVIAQIAEGYKDVKSRPVPAAFLCEEPAQMAPRELIEEAPIEVEHFHFSWHIPDLRHPDTAALDVLSLILGGGRSSRLYKEVREKQALALSADAWTYNPGLPGIFGMSGITEPGKCTAAREAMLAELEKVRTGTISETELAKAKKQFRSGMLSTRKTMSGQAQELGSNWVSATDLSFSQRYLGFVDALTTDDLSRVARKYLNPTEQTFFALVPTGSIPNTTEENTDNETSDIQKIELPNGLRLLIKEDHKLPFVQTKAIFNGGVLSESSENNGTTSLMGKMLLKGTNTRTGEQIAEEIESIGGHIHSYGGNNSFGVELETLSEDFHVGLDLLKDVLLNPVFDADILEREKGFQIASIQARRDNLLQSCGRLMRQRLFGKGGYGLDALGTEESVTSISADSLRSFYQERVAPQHGVIVIFGDVKVDQIKADIEKAFGDWTNDKATPPIHPFEGKGDPGHLVETRDKEQAVIVMAFPTIAFDNSDRHALDLIQEACSDMGSRLFLKIRDELGLAYYVGAQTMPGKTTGYFSFYSGTQPDKVEQVEEEFLNEIKELKANGLSQEELDRSKAKTLGQKKIGRQELSALGMAAALDELFGLGYANYLEEEPHISAITVEDTKRVAQTYFDVDKMVVSVIKPAS
ncbi:insulinase family protein [bacterium]|nr:insulinase family protein [bacterium]